MFVLMPDAAFQRYAEVLGKLVEMDLVLAQEAFAECRAAEDLEERGKASRIYQRHARSCRQNMALHAKLERERAEGPSPEVEKRLWRARDRARIETRKADLRTALHRIIWCEREGEQADYLCDLLEERLELHGRSPAFGLNRLDDHIREFCDAFGFPPGSGNDWRRLPDPEWTDDEADADEAQDAEPELEASG
jgi:hypothetical protein